MRKHPTRSTRLFAEAGWAATTFHGRPARRGPGGWVAWYQEGEWHLWRDTSQGGGFFACYQTVNALLRDAEIAVKLDRTRTELRESGPKAWERTSADGREWSTSEWSPAPGWAHDDPRWGV
jgi:hypothetical protein